MSSDAPGPRPRQVTIGGWLVAIASAMLVVTVFDTMARLHSVDTRDELTRVLTTGSTRDLGISVADALGVFRAALFVAGAAAAVTGVLGIFVLQRHTAARIVLTIAAVPVVLTAPFSGGFLAILVGGGTAMLWSRPARDWFAGRPPMRTEIASRRPQPAPPPPVRRPEAVWPPPTTAPPGASGSRGPAPAPTPGWGRQPAQPASWPPAYATGPAFTPPVRDLPAQVRVACILTWIFSALTGGLYLVIAVALLADRSGMLRLLRDNRTVRDTKLTDDQLVAAIVTVSVLVVLWCVAACVLAGLVWRRHAWARTLLMVSIAFAFAVELVGFPYSLLHLAAGVVAFRMLLSPGTRAWFRGAERPGGPPSGWRPPPGWAPPSLPPDHAAPPPDGRRSEDEPSERPAGKPPVW